MFFLQQGPAETTNYMILGFAVIFVTMLLHVISLSVRRRNLEKDIAFLEELEAK